MSLPAILATLIRHQIEIAETLAEERGIVDTNRRQRLADEIRLNAADFKRFVDTHQISVKERPCAPRTMRTSQPHCETCSRA